MNTSVELMKLLKALQEAAENGDDRSVKVTVGEKDEHCDIPIEILVQDYHMQYQFKPGDMVRWKKGHKMANFPSYDQESIVLECYPDAEPLRDQEYMETGSFMRIYDIRLAMKMPDGSLGTFCYDSRYFEPIPTGKPN